MQTNFPPKTPATLQSSTCPTEPGNSGRGYEQHLICFMTPLNPCAPSFKPDGGSHRIQGVETPSGFSFRGVRLALRSFGTPGKSFLEQDVSGTWNLRPTPRWGWRLMGLIPRQLRTDLQLSHIISCCREEEKPSKWPVTQTFELHQLISPPHVKKLWKGYARGKKENKKSNTTLQCQE